MVVIEPVPQQSGVVDEEEKRLPNTNKPSKDESTTSSSSAAADATAGYNSEGFETASEADLNEDDVVGDEPARVTEDSTEAEKRTADQGETKEELQVELSQEEINEKALEEANNAKLEGNNLFKDGLYEEALLKYDTALQAQSIPFASELSSACYANRAACYSKLGKFEDTIKECTKALELNPKYMKVLLRRAEAHEKLEHFEEAIADITKVLEIDPANDQARRSIVRLKPLADEKREKMKEEMMGKLKEMGNSILGRFGMSVDNFQAVKDPNTGSYSISFQR